MTNRVKASLLCGCCAGAVRLQPVTAPVPPPPGIAPDAGSEGDWKTAEAQVKLLNAISAHAIKKRVLETRLGKMQRLVNRHTTIPPNLGPALERAQKEFEQATVVLEEAKQEAEKAKLFREERAALRQPKEDLVETLAKTLHHLGLDDKRRLTEVLDEKPGDAESSASGLAP